jgi:amidohydrolase
VRQIHAWFGPVWLLRGFLRSAAAAAAVALASPAQADLAAADLASAARSVDARVIEWRRDFHQHPELSNRETRTARVIAERLRGMGLEVKTGIALTGVTALLRGAQPGRTIALRADMDALPVTEAVDLPFKSTQTTQYRGATVGVMHACGHDAHSAILLGVAQVLSGLSSQLRGQVLFVFQPAEEGAPDGEKGGAGRMLAEGALDKPKPEAMFGLHVVSSLPTGVIGYRSGPMMAASDRFTLQVTGRQTHGSRPWSGVDPIVASAQIITGLQSIVSRQLDITEAPLVISIGAIQGGIRYNIIPDGVEMLGTLRSFDAGMRNDAIRRMELTAKSIAQASGATATLSVRDDGNPTLVNDPALTARVLPSLERVAGKPGVRVIGLQTTAEDFAHYARRVPSFFFWVGITPPRKDPATAAFNHSPLFFVDEAGLAVGLRALLAVAVDYLEQPPETAKK